MKYAIGKFVCGALAITSWITAVVGGLYIGIWLMFICGIVQIVEACKVDPVSGFGIGVGAFRVVAASFVGVFSFYFGVIVGGIFMTLATHYAGKQRMLSRRS